MNQSPTMDTSPLGGAPALDYRALGALFRHRADSQRPPRAGLVGAVALLVASLLLPAVPAHAKVIAVAAGVADTGDDGACSLREAIANAEADSKVHTDCPPGSGADVITLPAGTYDLDFPIRQPSADDDSALVIHTDITVVGAGVSVSTAGAATILDAGGTRRHFKLAHQGARLTLVGLRLEHGYAEFGGAVFNQWGHLATQSVAFVDNHADKWGGAVRNDGVADFGEGTSWSGNTATEGGAIHNTESLTITGGTLSGNGAHRGAAVASRVSSDATLVDTRVVLNEATVDPGAVNMASIATAAAILSTNSQLTVTGSTVAQNAAVGIVNDGGVALITNSTISDNSGGLAGGVHDFAHFTCGGGCLQHDTTTVIRNSTISGNTASRSTNYSGGGVLSTSEYIESCPDGVHPDGCSSVGNLTLINVTVAGNSAPSAGAQLSSLRSEVMLRNTIVAGSSSANCKQWTDLGGFWVSQNTLSDDASCPSGFTQVSDALLQPLADNGGPTHTHLPHPASPAVNAGFQGSCNQALWDQRGAGFPRTVGAACDIGAVEVGVLGALGVMTHDVGALPLRSGPQARNDGLRTSLLAKLTAAEEAVDRGDHDAAAGQLGAFNNQVEAHSGGPIMETDAARLTTGARVIIDLFPEGGSPPADGSPPEDGR